MASEIRRLTAGFPTFALSLALGAGFVACGTEAEDDPDTGVTDTGTDVGDDTTSDVSTDTPGDTNWPDTGSPCESPDPSQGCLDGGCPDGQVCVLDETACAPSVCSCDEASGTWECTADCGPGNVCVPDDPTCPADAPDPRDTCSAEQEGLNCEYGTECCCGECYASYGCDCTDGNWACYATDACFIESCLGRECETDADCEGGERNLVCSSGICAELPNVGGCWSLPDRDTCDATSGCEWMFPPGCSEPDDDTLDAAGCYPSARCGGMGGEACPDGSMCVEDVAVSPRCAFEEPLCDACVDYRGLCYQTR